MLVCSSLRFSKVSAPASDDEIYFAMDWLAQHIKNTDFGYKGHLKHEVPEPYVWDTSFVTDVSCFSFFSNMANVCNK